MFFCLAALALTAAGPTVHVELRAPRQFKNMTTALPPYWMLTSKNPFKTRNQFFEPEIVSEFNMYANSGGLLVGPGLRTNAFVYDCDPSRAVVCRIGRSDITLPRNLGPLVGLTLHIAKLLMTEARLKRGLPVPRGGVSGLLAALPVINLAILDQGAYTNVLFAY
jgi:hypothetical protein